MSSGAPGETPTIRSTCIWVASRVFLPAIIFLFAIVGFVLFRPGTIAYEKVELGPETVGVSVYERDGLVYIAHQQMAGFCRQGWGGMQLAMPASELGDSAIRIEVDEPARAILIHIGDRVFTISPMSLTTPAVP